MSQTRRLSQLFAADDWLANYRFLVNADFKAYDFDTLRAAFIDHIKRNYPEDFNDFINSSEYVAIIDLLAFLGQNLAFRSDLNLRESFLETAESRQSILNIARQIGYTVNRNVPAKGFLRVASVTTQQEIFDNLGNNLSGQTVVWGDPNNPDFQEQFTAILNEVFNKNNPFGRPIASSTNAGTLSELYEIDQSSDENFIQPISIQAKNGNVYTSEVAPMFLGRNGVIVENIPNPYNKLNMLFNNNGTGFSSNANGWFFYFTQGTLNFTDFKFDVKVENRIATIEDLNINNSDVWVQNVDAEGNILINWVKAGSVDGQNIIFNEVDKDVRKIYEVLTGENDTVAIKFGDGVFADIPTDNIRVWHRTSANETFSVGQADVQGLSLSFEYIDSQGKRQYVSFELDLTQDVNSLASESIDRIRTRASRTAASQNRMINAVDYNVFPEGRVPGISKIKAVNRIHTGQSIYSDLQDPTGTYRPVITTADDGFIYVSETTKEKLVENTLSTELIFEAMNNSLLDRQTHQLYYKKYQPLSTDIFTGGNLSWVGVDTTGQISHGYFAELTDTPIKIGRTTVDSRIRSLFTGSIIKSSNGTWHRVLEVNRGGFGVQDADGNPSGRRADGTGSVYISGTLRNASIVSWLPGLRLNFSANEKSEIIEEIKNRRNFGLAYRYEEDRWVVLRELPQGIDPDETLFPLIKTGNFDHQVGRNWLVRLEHNQTTQTWSIYNRQDLTVFGSEQQLSFHNQRFGQAIDQTSNRLIKDKIIFLKDGTKLVKQYELDIYDHFVLDEGRYDPSRVIVLMPGLDDFLSPDNPETMAEIIGSGNITLLKTPFIDAPGQFTLKPRKIGDTTAGVERAGRIELTVKSKHAPLRDNRVDAVTTNIIDMFVLTENYDISFRRWLQNTRTVKPMPLTSYQLEQLMAGILPFKSISDSVVFHPAKYKVIFGAGARREDQVVIRVTKTDGTKNSNAEIRSKVISAINQYFQASNWDFGETFFFTDMASWVHERLRGIITNIALLPLNESQSNRLFQIRCENDELFLSSATVNDVDVLTSEQVPLPSEQRLGV